MSKRKSASVNENWIKTESLNDYKKQAKEVSIERSEKVKGMKQVTIPHPTSPRAVIIKYI